MSSSTNAEALKFKEGDELGFPLLHAHTTDKLLLASSDGRFYTLAADKLPGGRGFGEPVKLMVDIEGEGNVVALLRAGAAEKLLLASSDGRGFVTAAAGAIAETRKGKQIVNLRPGAKLRWCGRSRPGDDYVAVIGENRKLVVYPLAELPEMGARPGRPAPALSRRRPGRRHQLHLRRRPQLGDGRRERPHPHRDRPESLAHRARRRRPHAAARLPADNRNRRGLTAFARGQFSTKR